jgi:FkbM family methyltransferase
MSVSKKYIRDNILRFFGMERSYMPTFLVKNKNLIYDRLIHDIISSRIKTSKDFNFIQVGGFDGISNDIIKPIISNYQIEGIILEPQVFAYEKLVRNYKEFPNVEILNVGVSDADCIRDFHFTKDYPSQVCSVDYDHLIKHKVPPSHISNRKVQFLTIDSLMVKFEMGNLDFLQIDAEGHDFSIIKSINFRNNRPRIIRFEAVHMTQNKLSELLSILSDYEYQFVIEGNDITAIFD